MPEYQQTQRSTESKSTVKKQATPRIQVPISHPMAIIQRARINPKSLTPADILQLQRTIGNRAVGRLLSEIRSSSTAQKAPIQRQEIPEEEKTCPSCMQRKEIPEDEEPLQGNLIEPIQRQEIPEEEKPLQGKFENKPEIASPSCFASPIVQRQEIPEEEEPLQGKMIGTVQRQEIPEEEEPLQGKFETIQRQEIPDEEEPLQTKRENNTGMPDNLKAGVESLSGIDMSDVRVHYNSSKPAEVGALAYTQGTDIHVAPGQERHLPHEGWHVVQQKQGRVQATAQMKGLSINDDPSLEHEADMMGVKMAQKAENAPNNKGLPDNLKAGIENLSGMSMDGVKVHYNYEKPAQLNALAYVQGSDIHVGTVQEKHLAHKAWHVVQQGHASSMKVKNSQSPRAPNQCIKQKKSVQLMSAKATLNSANPITMPGDSTDQLTGDGAQLANQFEKVLPPRYTEEDIKRDSVKDLPEEKQTEYMKEFIDKTEEAKRKRVRPRCQCAEPKAVVNVLAAIEMETDLANPNITISEINENGQPKKPCLTCREWVSGDGDVYDTKIPQALLGTAHDLFRRKNKARKGRRN